MKTIRELQSEAHQNALGKGWWNKPVSFGDLISNMHAELSEAFEEYRKGKSVNEIYTSEGGKPEGIPVELADCVIRIFDFCGQYDIDLNDVIIKKMEYNRTRSFRHGGKVV